MWRRNSEITNPVNKTFTNDEGFFPRMSLERVSNSPRDMLVFSSRKFIAKNLKHGLRKWVRRCLTPLGKENMLAISKWTCFKLFAINFWEEKMAYLVENLTLFLMTSVEKNCVRFLCGIRCFFHKIVDFSYKKIFRISLGYLFIVTKSLKVCCQNICSLCNFWCAIQWYTLSLISLHWRSENLVFSKYTVRILRFNFSIT